MISVSGSGIDVWHPRSQQFIHLNSRAGVDVDSTSQVLNNITADVSGNVYLPFEDGLLQLSDLDTTIDIRPYIKISGVSLFFNQLRKRKQQFDHDENHISFRFEGINFIPSDQLQYRYMLEGYHENWVYTSDEVVPFAQLSPGAYTFRVQASLNSNFEHAHEDSFSFTISRPFWKQPWFLALAAGALIGLGYLYIKLREKGIKKMSTLQKERMIFEYEHLKSQVNPHFLFNSLNTLVSLIEEDKEAAVDYTVHLSDLYRYMLSFKDQDLILLEEELRIINHYMHIQKSRFGEALQLQINLAEDVPRRKKIVPLALQLLVENAVKHNVVSLKQPLVITIEADEEKITVRNPIRPKHSKEKGAGLGLINIRKRYSLLTNRNTVMGASQGEYIVTLPLLRQILP